MSIWKELRTGRSIRECPAARKMAADIGRIIIEGQCALDAAEEVMQMALDKLKHNAILIYHTDDLERMTPDERQAYFDGLITDSSRSHPQK